MPTDYQPTGAMIDQGGKMVPAMAPIYVCEVCGHRGSTFGQKRGDDVLSYCGWVDGHPECIGLGRADQDRPKPERTIG